MSVSIELPLHDGWYGNPDASINAFDFGFCAAAIWRNFPETYDVKQIRFFVRALQSRALDRPEEDERAVSMVKIDVFSTLRHLVDSIDPYRKAEAYVWRVEVVS